MSVLLACDCQVTNLHCFTSQNCSKNVFNKLTRKKTAIGPPGLTKVKKA